MKTILHALLIITLFSSCASILNPRYQKVSIISPSGSQVLVDEKIPEMKKGKYLLKRDLKAKQITIRKAGFKDENVTVFQYKKSPFYILSIVPFGILIYPMTNDVFPKATNFDKEMIINDLTRIPEREKLIRSLKLNKISLNTNEENVQFRKFDSYIQFKRKQNKKKSKVTDDSEDLKIENTMFTEQMNELLAKHGYIDSTKTLLNQTSINDLFIEASIEQVTFHQVNSGRYQYNSDLSKSRGMAMLAPTGSFVYIDLGISWKIVDYYNKTLFTSKFTSRSGQFAIYEFGKSQNAVQAAMKDAVESGLIKLIEKPETTKLLNQQDGIVKDDSYTELIIKSSEQYVSDINESIESSVTILTKDGHGSGFLISSDGYLLTSYHVVSEGVEGLSVLLNNGKKYTPEIIRFSRINDYALLKINETNLKPFKLDASNINIGSDIYVVGTPSSQDLSQSVSKGIISGIRKIESDKKLIQTDASVNAGNSGGAIVNKNGMVIGIVKSKIVGLNIEGLAFGIPIDEIVNGLNLILE